MRASGGAGDAEMHDARALGHRARTEPWRAESQSHTPGRGLGAILTWVPRSIDKEREGQQTFSVTLQRVNILGFAVYYSLIIFYFFTTHSFKNVETILSLRAIQKGPAAGRTGSTG